MPDFKCYAWLRLITAKVTASFFLFFTFFSSTIRSYYYIFFIIIREDKKVGLRLSKKSNSMGNEKYTY